METDATKIESRRSFDEHGRIIPMTEAEVKARAQEVARCLDSLEEIGDAEESRRSLAALIEALGEHRFFSDKPFPE